MAGRADATARNNFRNVGVGLHPELDRGTSGPSASPRNWQPIVAASEHPATRASAAAFAAVPAPLLRWGMRPLRPRRPARRPSSGHTVVSSVNRGPADLTFGGRRVLFTAGYPGAVADDGPDPRRARHRRPVAVSVHADPAVVDVDDYLDRLARALP